MGLLLLLFLLVRGSDVLLFFFGMFLCLIFWDLWVMNEFLFFMVFFRSILDIFFFFEFIVYGSNVDVFGDVFFIFDVKDFG